MPPIGSYDRDSGYIKGGTDDTHIGNVDDSAKVNVTNEIEVITHVHDKVHEGWSFTCSDDLTLDANDKYRVNIDTNAVRQGHLTFEIKASGSADIKLYEDPSGVSGGNGVTENNRNRNSANTADITVKKGVTTTDDGDKIDQDTLFGTNQTSPGVSGSRAEFILKEDEDYIVWIKSIGNGNRVQWKLNWYEE